MNDRIYIEGGHQLKGSIRIQGSKNAALPMMAASLLHRGVSVLKGCPRIADVFCMEEILQKLGAVTWWEDHDLYMDCGLPTRSLPQASEEFPPYKKHPRSADSL